MIASEVLEPVSGRGVVGGLGLGDAGEVDLDRVNLGWGVESVLIWGRISCLDWEIRREKALSGEAVLDEALSGEAVRGETDPRPGVSKLLSGEPAVLTLTGLSKLLVFPHSRSLDRSLSLSLFSSFLILTLFFEDLSFSESREATEFPPRILKTVS